MNPGRRLLLYFARYRRDLLTGALCVVFSVGFSLTKPLIIRNAVDDLTHGVTLRTLLLFSGLFLGAAVIEGVFLYLQRWIIIGASRKIEYDMRNDFFAHLQSLPLRFYQNQRTGDLMSRATNDLSSVRMLIGPAVMHSFGSLLVVTGAFIMMVRINLQLALMALVAVPIVAGAVKFFGQRIHVRFRAVQDYFGDISARVQENLAGVRVVRAFGQENNEVDRFGKMNREYVDRNRSLINLTATFYPFLHCIIGLLFVLVFWVGSKKILAGQLSIGSFVAFQFYLARMIWPLIALGWVINLFQRGMASMKRLTDIWNEKPDAHPDEGVKRELEPVIEIDHLTFAYDERAVLQDVTLRIPAGATVGIVGRTGSGKSTLLSLIARIYEPPTGTIRIGGVPIEAIAPGALREMIGMVPQETFLFSDSIAENIRFGRETAPAEEVEKTASLAGLTDDLSSFPQGIDTVVGERGITLSGGQKQRTAIARAIIRNPSILMLDDSLSAVDTQTEERILRSLAEVRKGRTVLIVSHRVSSVKDADEIVVLDDGRVVESGTHDELIERDGYYADLYRQQALEAEIEEIA